MMLNIQQCNQENKDTHKADPRKVVSGNYYSNYHGHQIRHLTTIHAQFQSSGKTNFVYLCGDSSLVTLDWSCSPGLKSAFSNPTIPPDRITNTGYSKSLRTSESKCAMKTSQPLLLTATRTS